MFTSQAKRSLGAKGALTALPSEAILCVVIGVLKIVFLCDADIIIMLISLVSWVWTVSWADAMVDANADEETAKEAFKETESKAAAAKEQGKKESAEKSDAAAEVESESKENDKESIDAKAKENFEKGDVVRYRGGVECEVIATHQDDVERYYTIKFADGKQRQTTRKSISHKEKTAGKEDAQGRMPRLKTSSKQFAFFAFVCVVIGVLKIVFLCDADIIIMLISLVSWVWTVSWADAMVDANADEETAKEAFKETESKAAAAKEQGKKESAEKSDAAAEVESESKENDKESIDAKAKENFEKGDVVRYRGGVECEVIATHQDDVERYYTIKFADGKQRQTTRKSISHKEKNDAGNSYVTRTKCSKYRKAPRCFNKKYEWARSRCAIRKEIRKDRREKDRERRSTRRHHVSVAKDVNHHVSVATDVNTSSKFALNFIFIVSMFCAYVLHLLCNYELMRLCSGDYILPNDTEIPSACYLIYIMNTLLSTNTSIRRFWSQREKKWARKLKKWARKQRRLEREFGKCFERELKKWALKQKRLEREFRKCDRKWVDKEKEGHSKKMTTKEELATPHVVEPTKEEREEELNPNLTLTLTLTLTLYLNPKP